MLSQSTRKFLSGLTYRADAEQRVVWFSLSGIYWDDEFDIPESYSHIPSDDRSRIYRLFRLRVWLWRGKALSDRDKQFWDAIRSEVPQWAFFQRLQVSAEDLRSQDNADRVTNEILDGFIACTDGVTIGEAEEEL